MFEIDNDMTIYITRGDVAFFSVTAEDNGERYKFQPGDVVRIKVTQKKNCENVAFQKDFPVLEETETVEILLTEEETKIGDVISKPVDYWYEVELNPYTNPQTIIGYDDDGPKIFKLFPEGKDLGPNTVPEDVPVVDSELSLTSDRPVQNQAVTRAMSDLFGIVKKVSEDGSSTVAAMTKKVDDAVNKASKDTERLDTEIAVERARINNLVANTGEQTEGNAELIDIRTGADGKVYETAGEAVRGQVGDLKSDLIQCINKLSESVGGVYKFAIKAGKKYYITVTDGKGEMNINTRTTKDGSTVERIATGVNTGYSAEWTATQNTEYVHLVFSNYGTVTITDMESIEYRVKVAEENIQTNAVNISTNEMNIRKYTNGIEVKESSVVPFDIVAGKTYYIAIKDTLMDVNVQTRTTENGDTVERIAHGKTGGYSAEWTATQDASYVRVLFGGSTGSVLLMDNDTGERKIIDMEQKLNSSITSPLIRLETDTLLKDVSNYVTLMDYSNHSQQADVLEQVYALFDELVTTYPNYVTKADAAEECGLSYPLYAQGITTEGEYQITPEYKTYIYKFVDKSVGLGTNLTGRWKKKKLFIVAGTHGNEIVAPFNAYMMAKQLCDGSDANYFRLRSIFDVYIIPCLNGYGMYHLTRANANKVNINRNYPVANWVVAGEDTKDDIGTNNYTGATAGSEFETQLIMAQTELIAPDVAFDHHNYSWAERQFFTITSDEKLLPLTFQSAVDCAIAFKNALPEYFGSSYGQITELSGSAPTAVERDNGTTSCWWWEKGIDVSATLEISQNINYLNGVVSAEQDKFGNDTFSVGEYTLRNQIMRYCQYLLEHSK